MCLWWQLQTKPLKLAWIHPFSILFIYPAVAPCAGGRISIQKASCNATQSVGSFRFSERERDVKWCRLRRLSEVVSGVEVECLMRWHCLVAFGGYLRWSGWWFWVARRSLKCAPAQFRWEVWVSFCCACIKVEKYWSCLPSLLSRKAYKNFKDSRMTPLIAWIVGVPFMHSSPASLVEQRIRFARLGWIWWVLSKRKFGARPRYIYIFSILEWMRGVIWWRL